MIEIRVRIDTETFFHRRRNLPGVKLLFVRSGRRSGRALVLLGNCRIGDAYALPGRGGARAKRFGRGGKKVGKLLQEAGGGIFQQHAILRAFRTGDARLNSRQIQFQRLRVNGFRRTGGMEQALLLVISFDQGDLVFAAAGQPQVAQGFRVHRKDTAGCAILGRHIADGGAIGEGKLRDA